MDDPLPPIMVPSCEYAHEVIFVRAPRSLDFTTMTVFCLRLFSTSHILCCVHERFNSMLMETDEPNGRVGGRGDESLGVLGMPHAGRQFPNMTTSIDC